MPEPNASAAAGIALAAGAVTLTGSFLGMPYDALLGGFGGGLVAVMYHPPQPRRRVFLGIVAASFLGGAFSAPAVAAVTHQAGWLAGVGESPLRMAAAVTIGLFAQVVIPVAFKLLERKGGAL